jgi:hypothetical protein
MVQESLLQAHFWQSAQDAISIVEFGPTTVSTVGAETIWVSPALLAMLFIRSVQGQPTVADCAATRLSFVGVQVELR